MSKFLSAFVAAALAAMPVGGFAQSYPFQDSSLPVEKRVDNLLSLLTIQEKAQLMTDESPAIERLGIPTFHWWNEALHGVGRNGTATVFPITMGMAASWDDALVYRVFSAVSDEARAKNTAARRAGTPERYQGLSFWTPNINIFRDPRWGRGQETYGEDPYLTGQMGLQVVKGLQGPSTSKYRKLLACAKHFAVHSGPEPLRHRFNIEDLPARDLWETYLPAFATLVREGNVAEVMCAYQSIDGQPCCGNNQLMRHILREELGFKGLVVSDCGAISDFWRKGTHEVSKDAAEASAVAVSVGTDLSCGDDYRQLDRAVADGQISEAKVDESLRRLLKARFELGNFDSDSDNEWTRIPQSVVASPEHKALALRMARESMTLLHNRRSALPLSTKTPLVVMGPNAADSTMLWGNYNGFPTSTVTILQGIRHKAANVKYVDLGEKLDMPFDEVLRQVGKTKDIVFVGGISPRLEGEELQVDIPGFKGGDRTTIELPESQRTLVRRLHEAGKRVYFVNCSGSAVALEPETRNCEAILQAWYGGEAAGTAVAEVLFGDVNPSGHLPVTFYASDSDLPDFENYAMTNRTYRYFTGKPLFPFGYGQSYTTFKISASRYDAVSGTVSVDIANTGKRDGTAVVQVYLRRPADVDGPQKTLRAFQRVDLAKGEHKTVAVALPRDRFEWWDTSTNTMRVLPGEYQVMTGLHSADPEMKVETVNIN